MKAIDFVRKFGLSEFKELYLASLYVDPFRPQSDKIIGIKKSEIKELFDAFELVQSYGGLKSSIETHNCFKNACDGVGIKHSPKMVILKQAINLVEQCQ